jgi:hypothetical protein
MWPPIALLCAMAACGRIGFPDPDPSDGIAGLVTCYEMDVDPSSGVAPATDAAYDGHCTKCPTLTAGHLGGGYAFDGVRTDVALPAASAGLVGQPPNTVTVWALVPTAQEVTGLVSKPLDDTSSANPFKLETATSDGIGTVAYETCNPTAEALVGSANVVGQWHHVAASWDGAVKRLYVDGVLAGTQAATIVDSALPLTLGADIDAGTLDLYFLGTLDDLCFWNRPLADSEIEHLAAQ